MSASVPGAPSPGTGYPYTRWISVPVPRPPPQHIVTRPISLSERSTLLSTGGGGGGGGGGRVAASGRSGRVAEQCPPTVDVNPVHVRFELAAPGPDHRGEGRVELDQVDV